MVIDTHTHLYLPEFDADDCGEAAVRRAIDAGVGHMVFPGIDSSSLDRMTRLRDRFPDNIRLALGLHPTEVNERWQDELDKIVSQISHTPDTIAIGEIGVDLYWDSTHRAQQIEAFDAQCRLALDLDLPIIIHCREALPEILDVLRSLPRTPKGVMHSFGGSPDDVKAVREVAPDIYFGINGIVTFRNSKLRDTLPEIGLDHILLETDSPYLAPVPMRGRRNESAYIIHILNHIASHLNIPADEVAATTTANADNLFKIICTTS